MRKLISIKGNEYTMFAGNRKYAPLIFGKVEENAQIIRVLRGFAVGVYGV